MMEIRKQDIKVVNICYHRNGITGTGFHVVLFDVEEFGRMIGIVFSEPGSCAVLKVGDLAEAKIDNRWRGDHFEKYLREYIEERPIE